jgi:hypothetical protein
MGLADHAQPKPEGLSTQLREHKPPENLIPIF